MTASPRIAHVGNIANNAYSNAKFQRRVGVAADSYNYPFEFVFGHPEWEDADFDARLSLFQPPDWRAVPFTNGYARPHWAKYISGRRLPYGYATYDEASSHIGLSGQLLDTGRVWTAVPGNGATAGQKASLAVTVRRLIRAAGQRYAALARQGQPNTVERLQLHILGFARLAMNYVWAWRVQSGLLLNDRLREMRTDMREVDLDSHIAQTGRGLRPLDYTDLTCWRSFRPLAQDYDLTVLNGPEVTKAALLPPDRPYIALEHATMRTLPFEDTLQGRLLTLGYQLADACIITNPDVISSAKRLGLRHYRFVPHPVDETKYCPGETRIADEVHRELRVALIFFCPSRHEWSNGSDSKRSDRVIRAFGRYVREAEPTGLPAAALVLTEWGTDVRASQRLCRDLGVERRVVWIHPMHKTRLLEYYRAADIVLDQFHDAVGSFGTVTVEAMACARPVIMYFNPKVHEWCLEENPPIQSALTAAEIYGQLVALAGSPERREAVGAQSRAWVERWHSWKRVAQAHLELYREVFDRRRNEEAVRALEAIEARMPAAGV
ncbi:MAG: hypothetical protein CL878_13125 [Dehalococcoidia bacterium]|nr:hypothetical protein [Dehalococcoidia bacterium]